jgi:diguanylate cyclase (GGDEF)-like protein
MANRREVTPIDLTKNVEMVERIASVTEELEDILAISQGKKTPWDNLNLKDIMKTSRKGTGSGTHPFLFSIFRLLTLQGLVRGRMTFNAYSTGKGLGENLTVKKCDQVVKTIKKLGMGRVKIIKCKEDTVNIRIYNDVTSMGIKDLKRPICYFEAGFLSGMLEKVLRKKVDLEECKCKAMNHPYCQFELYKPKKDDSLRTSIPVLPADMYSEENVRLLTTLASHAIIAIENALLFEKTKRQAVIDGLTQVYNHRYFQQIVKVEVKRAGRHQTPLSLIMMDIDNFKKFNDHYGHPKGDEVLKEIARILIENVRSIDIVARYGGDEMAVILPQTEIDGAMIVANRIKKKMVTLDILKKPKAKISLSQGIATYSVEKDKSVQADQLILKADRALLTAKKKGRNKIEFLKV